MHSDPEAFTESVSGTRFPNMQFATRLQPATSHTGESINLTFTLGNFPDAAPSPQCSHGYCTPDYSDGVWLEGCLASLQVKFFTRSILTPLANAYDKDDPLTEPYAERVLELLASWTSAYV